MIQQGGGVFTLKKTGALAVAARNSEIRAFLLSYAERKGILVKEYVSDWDDGPIAFFCHIQFPKSCPQKSATAISYQHPDNSLVMAFLNLGNPELNFIPD